MARAYFTIKDIPQRSATEGPATPQQLAQLRNLAAFQESDLAELGGGQAAYLIDQAEKARSQSGPAPAKGGFWKMARIVLILALVAVTVKILIDRTTDQQPQATPAVPEATGKTADAADPFARMPGGGATSPGQPRSSSNGQTTPPPPGTLTTLEGLVLPVVVTSTERFELLNAVGTETAIPVGCAIQIEKRGAKGALTLRIKGGVYVGNELRILGKVRFH